jgi:6-phosphogluconate dehydrogenase (decarboxylating)
LATLRLGTTGGAAGERIGTELLVQIPFLGFSVLQLIFGAVAIGMAVVGLLARRTGWWPRRRAAAGAPTDGIAELGAGAPPSQ